MAEKYLVVKIIDTSQIPPKSLVIYIATPKLLQMVPLRLGLTWLVVKTKLQMCFWQSGILGRGWQVEDILMTYFQHANGWFKLN